MPGTCNNSLPDGVVVDFRAVFACHQALLASETRHMRNLTQVRQRACLEQTVRSLTMNVYCVNKARIQNSSNVTRLAMPDIVPTAVDKAYRA